jgi:prolyl-tRNA synthetase
MKKLEPFPKWQIKLKTELEAAGISVKYDDRDNFKPGYKFNDYELKGVPLRIAIGPRDLENKVVELARRDTLEKNLVPMEGLTQHIKATLDEIQTQLFSKALKF